MSEMRFEISKGYLPWAILFRGLIENQQISFQYFIGKSSHHVGIKTSSEQGICLPLATL
jgi:hypothetical protein